MIRERVNIVTWESTGGATEPEWGATAAVSRTRTSITDHRATLGTSLRNAAWDMKQAEYPMSQIVALVDDLMFASRIAGTLGASGYDVRIVATVEELWPVVQERTPDSILVSFASPFLDWRGAIQAIRADARLAETPLLAFGPHVDTEARAAAKAVGADRVVTNGAFFARMAAIVGALIGSRGVEESGSRAVD
jgi:CheY-like chemotaxis protein